MAKDKQAGSCFPVGRRSADLTHNGKTDSKERQGGSRKEVEMIKEVDEHGDVHEWREV